MLAPRDCLTILTCDTSGETPVVISQVPKLCDLIRDNVSLTLDADTAIYLGYYKPIRNVFISVVTAIAGVEDDSVPPVVVEPTVTYEYWNGTAWADLEPLDDTDSLERSGFVTWESVAEKKEMCGVDQYWYRIVVDAECTLTLGGISLLFCDTRDLLSEDPRIADSDYLRGETSQIHALVAARDEIIQSLRNRGMLVVDQSTCRWKDLTSWDLLNVEQVRNAAKWCAISIIYRNLSDSLNDTFWQRHQHFQKKCNDCLKTLTLLSVDENDDGELTEAETQKSWRYGSMIR